MNSSAIGSIPASPHIGIDFGGTKAEAISLSASGEIEARIVVPTVPGVEGVLSVAEQVITTLAEETRRDVRDYAGVGIGIPGQVDRARGEVRNAYNMGFESLALSDALGAGELRRVRRTC